LINTVTFYIHYKQRKNVRAVTVSEGRKAPLETALTPQLH